jgi:anaerobic selenocysteine-containing dehydrogenase
MINPADAKTRGITPDSLVSVTSRTGQIQMPVLITDEMMPGVVCMPHLWGHNRKNTRQQVANANPGVSMNDITDVTVIDELTGNAIVNGVPVKVEAIDKVSGTQSTPEDETVEEYVA